MIHITYVKGGSKVDMQIEKGSMYKVRNKKSKASYLLSFDHKGEMILCGFDKNKVYI